MDINRMTEKVQTAIMNAQSIAVREQHQEVDEVHLFIAMLEDDWKFNESPLWKKPTSPSHELKMNYNKFSQRNLMFQGVALNKENFTLPTTYKGCWQKQKNL